MTRELAPSEWKSFLESFILQHDRWLVTVETLEGTERRIDVSNAPLEGITCSGGSGAAGQIVVTVKESGETVDSHRPFVSEDPVHLRVDSENGVDQGLEIEQADGKVTRIAFRSAIAPESVDGILP